MRQNEFTRRRLEVVRMGKKVPSPLVLSFANESRRDRLNAGIISALAFSPNGSGLLAAGSFSGSIGLYDTSAGHDNLVSLLWSDDQAGITQVSHIPLSILSQLISIL